MEPVSQDSSLGSTVIDVYRSETVYSGGSTSEQQDSHAHSRGRSMPLTLGFTCHHQPMRIFVLGIRSLGNLCSSDLDSFRKSSSAAAISLQLQWSPFLSLFRVTHCFTAFVLAFLAYGILRRLGHDGIAGWSWLFTFGRDHRRLCWCLFTVLPSSEPSRKRVSKPRGRHGSFSVCGGKIMDNHVIKENLNRGDMHNGQAVTPEVFGNSFLDYDMCLIYLLGLSLIILPNPTTSYWICSPTS